MLFPHKADQQLRKCFFNGKVFRFGTLRCRFIAFMQPAAQRGRPVALFPGDRPGSSCCGSTPHGRFLFPVKIRSRAFGRRSFRKTYLLADFLFRQGFFSLFCSPFSGSRRFDIFIIRSNVIGHADICIIKGCVAFNRNFFCVFPGFFFKMVMFADVFCYAPESSLRRYSTI